MKYYLVFILQFNDGKKDDKAIYEYEDSTTLVANFHQQVGNWMKASTTKSILANAFDSENRVYESISWTKPILEEEIKEA